MSSNKTLIIIVIITCFNGISLSATLYVGDVCTRHDNQPGTCKAITNCEWARVNKIRPNLLKTCSFENSVPIVCCGDLSTKPTTETSPVNCDGTIFDPDMLKECIDRATATTTTTVGPIGIRASMECQRLLANRGPSLDFHIYGGTEVELGEYPHMVALGYESQEIGTNYDFNCGGTLITRKHVLTAAHCLYPAAPDVVRMGTISLLSNDYQEIPVEKVEKHPGFSPSTKANDVAVLVLAQPADISDPESVYPACLESRTDIPLGLNATVTGWGKTEDQKKSSALLKATLQLVDNDECTKRFNKAQIFAARKGINQGQLCAWDPEFKKDSCQGDSGGPLHITRNSTKFVIGVTSFGVGCASQLPGVYARVSNYIPWIESVVWKT